MSASLIVDMGSTLVQPTVSIAPAVGVGGTPASGVIIGMPWDGLYGNTATQLAVTAGPSISGQFKVQVQCSDSLASGSFTDPTSGLAQMPGFFLSGGIVVVNSGNVFASGGTFLTYFQRPQRYARAVIMSGDQNNSPVNCNFYSQLKVSYSGIGASQSPAGSGTFVVNV